MRPYSIATGTCAFCGNEYQREYRHLGLFCSAICRNKVRTKDPVTAFWSRVDQSNADGCWLWTGRCDSFGYGKFSAQCRQFDAHRFSYELHFGPLGPGMEACHNCPGGDNPTCVAPHHLWAGTQADNLRDMREKGRARYWVPGTSERRRPSVSQLSSGAFKAGEAHRMAKLTESQAREIRSGLAAGERKCDLARRFGVSEGMVRRIELRKAWSHLP